MADNSVSMQLYVKNFSDLARYIKPELPGYEINIAKNEDDGTLVIEVSGGEWEENFAVAGGIHDALVGLGVAQIAPYDGEDVVEL